jgi:hypothetical protein
LAMWWVVKVRSGFETPLVTVTNGITRKRNSLSHVSEGRGLDYESEGRGLDNGSEGRFLDNGWDDVQE